MLILFAAFGSLGFYVLNSLLDVGLSWAWTAAGQRMVYGLAAGVWTQDMRRAFLMSEKLQAGTVWVNTYRAVSPIAGVECRVGSAESLAADERMSVFVAIGHSSTRQRILGLLRDQGVELPALVHPRAAAIDQGAARLMGIDVDRVIMVVFLIGPALGGTAGVMVGLHYGQINFTMGWVYGLKAFTAAIMGGIGNIPGAMVGGILLGVIEALGAAYISIAWKDAIAFCVLIVILIARPTGLLGERVAEKV